MADTKQPPLADTKTYIEEQGLSDAITSALVKVLAEKPADAKRRLVEHLSGSNSGAEQSVPFSVHAFEAAKGGCDVVPATTAVVFIEYQVTRVPSLRCHRHRRCARHGPAWPTGEARVPMPLSLAE